MIDRQATPPRIYYFLTNSLEYVPTDFIIRRLGPFVIWVRLHLFGPGASKPPGGPSRPPRWQVRP